jgi:lipopolysaccharide biosynthesis glycosyltransferase
MTVDIVFSLNIKIIVGLLAAINSVVKNATQPENLRFNIVIPMGEREQFTHQLQTTFGETAWQWRIQEFMPPPYMCDYLDKRFSPMSPDRRNSRHMLFARFYLGKAFPDLRKVIYLDADLVVLQDIAELYHSHNFTPERYFAAVPHFFPSPMYFTQPWGKRQWAEARQFKKSFNAGVQFTDLGYWNEATEKKLHGYLEWDASNNYQTFQLGDEPLFNLLFKDYIQLESKWNCCGYGNSQWVARLLKKPLSDIAVLHWSGGLYKPWQDPKIVYGDIWRQYALPVAS